MPYSIPNDVTAHDQLNGVPLYIYMNAIFATVI